MHLHQALHCFFISCGNGGTQLLQYSALALIYFKEVLPLSNFFQQSCENHTYQCGECIECSESEIEVREIVDEKVCDPDEARVEECSERIKNVGWQGVIQFVYKFADFFVDFVKFVDQCHIMQLCFLQWNQIEPIFVEQVTVILKGQIDMNEIEIIGIAQPFINNTNCYIVHMNGLINNLTRFINISLELYAPLPYEFTIDLHTLNAYLKDYEQKQQSMLERFVNRLASKLAAKNRSHPIKEEPNDSGQGSLEQVLRHYNSCTIKFPQLKLELPSENTFQRSFNFDSKANSYRSDTSKNEGIKPNRHKFATRNKAKQLNLIAADNKQNTSVVANINTYPDILEESQDRSLKFIKSQAQLNMPSFNHSLRNISVETKRQQKSIKARPRYESNDNKVYPSQLKIKIKPKTTTDLRKIAENLNEVSSIMHQNDKEINNLCSHLDSFKQSASQLQQQ